MSTENNGESPQGRHDDRRVVTLRFTQPGAEDVLRRAAEGDPSITVHKASDIAAMLAIQAVQGEAAIGLDVTSN